MISKNLLKSIGPGILFAGAAIGGSHLIQSTRAGANFGLDLLFLVFIINLLKYPFFEYGHRYTAVTGESLLNGYLKLGKPTVTIFFFLNVITAIVNGAAVTIVTIGLTQNLFGSFLPTSTLTVLVIIFSLFVLFVGKYAVLDSVLKVMIVILAVTTVVTVIVALGIDSNSTANESTLKPDLFSSAGIAFLLALMGWMPAPIESSVWPSLWALERSKQTNYKPNLKESLIDFHIGYIGTTIMALFFVGLGAFVMFGSGETFSNSGIIFSSQLVSLYTKTIGNWSQVVISTIVFVTMLSTMLTVYDAYPRTIAGSFNSIKKFKGINNTNLYWVSGIMMGFFSYLIIVYFVSGLKTLIDFATILSFLAAPVFAIINYKVVNSKFMPKEYHPKTWLKVLSIIGIIFLSSFSILYIGTRIF